MVSWKWTAVIMAVVVALTNLMICKLYIQWQREKAQYQVALQESNTMRDQAIQTLGIMAENTAKEQQARADQVRAYETVGTYEYLGVCKITAYCCEPYEHICGTGDGLTATGIPVSPGIVAVDPDVIPLGSTVVIDGQSYLAADTGGMVKGLHVDIAVATHVEAEDFGVQVAEVWVIPQESSGTP